MKLTRVLLADDHRLMRAGIRALLEKIRGVEVVGEADDGQQTLHLVRQLKPDVVMMDIAMGKHGGLEATARLTAEYPLGKTVVLSMYVAEEYVIRALQAGAVGYMLKDAATAEVELALQAVTRGETYLSRALSRPTIEARLALANRSSLSHEPLTPRQREILRWIAEGKSTKEIAFELSISAKTVETHRAHMMTRLKIFDVASLVRYAMREGLVRGEQPWV